MTNNQPFSEPLLIAFTAAPALLAVIFTLFLTPDPGGFVVSGFLLLLTIGSVLSARTMVRRWFHSMNLRMEEQVFQASAEQVPFRDAQTKLGNTLRPVWGQQIETGRDYEAKLFGGASMFDVGPQGRSVARRNVEFTEALMVRHGLSVAARNLGELATGSCFLTSPTGMSGCVRARADLMPCAGLNREAPHECAHLRLHC